MSQNNLLISKSINKSSLDELRKALDSAKHLMAYYQCALMEIETKLKVLNTQFSLQQDYNPIETIKTRVKSPESIFEKMQRKNIPPNLTAIEENMYDIAGVRVICPFISDIYMLTQCLLEQDDIQLIEIKDYIKHPKENGYRSLHMIVSIPIFLQNEKKPMKVEIQLRTIAMDFWASLEHRLRYKKELDDETAKQIADELKRCAEDSSRLDIRMGGIKDAIERSKDG